MIHLTQEERDRLIDAEWQSIEKVPHMLYQTELQVIGTDRVGLLMDISKILTDANIPVKSLNARSEDSGKAIFNITMEINGVHQLNKISKKIRALEGVHDILRPNS